MIMKRSGKLSGGLLIVLFVAVAVACGWFWRRGTRAWRQRPGDRTRRYKGVRV